MENKSVISLIAILILIVGISGCIDNSQNTSGNNTVQNTTQNSNTQNTTKLSSNEAKSIAQKFIEEPNATAGEPVLINTDGKATYVVPVILNGNQVGEILIDAQSGENMGGAGGVSNSTK